MDIRVILLAVLLPVGTLSLHCYRCFGNSQCNPPLAAEAAVEVNCSNSYFYIAPNNDGSSIGSGLGSLFHEVQQAEPLNDEIPLACLLTHYVEDRETHTMRVCVTNFTNSTTSVCDRVKDRIFGAGNNNTDGFYCNTCTTDYCNNGSALKGGAVATSVSYVTVFVVTVFAILLQF